MTPLCELAAKYDCDKTVSVFHNYTPFYHELLRGRDIKRVLEIGIGSKKVMGHVDSYQPGASLRMWRDYFPEAEIWGLDVDPDVMVNEDRINSLWCDQSSITSLTRVADALGGRFDFILDDGSHRCEHQALTANMLIPRLLASKGVYVIEDVIWRRELYSLLPWPVEVKIFNLKRTPDDCVFVIEKENIF